TKLLATARMRTRPEFPWAAGTSFAGGVALAMLWGGEPIEILYNTRQRQNVGEVQFDVQQVHFVHDLAALAHGFPRHDHPEAVGGIPAGGVNAMAGADSGDDEGVHTECSKVHVE